MNTLTLHGIESRFWPKGERRDIWMIVDGARDKRIFSILLDSHLEFSCLYSGSLAPELELAAPYFVRLEYDDKSTRRFLQLSFNQSWGIFLKCDQGLKNVRQHLRKFLLVHDPNRGVLVFRFYDPRVLRVYLPTCTKSELQEFFGPIECFWTEAEEPDTMLEFAFNQRELFTRTLEIGDGAGALR